MRSFRRTAISSLVIASLAPAIVVAVSSTARAQGEPTAPGAPPPAPPGAPTTPPAAPTAPLIPPESTPDKAADEKILKGQGEAPGPAAGVAPAAAGAKGTSTEVFADDWWTHTRPLIEFHGFFRTRGELFHNFSLGRIDDATSDANLFPRPADDSYTDLRGNPHNVPYCGPSDNPTAQLCENKTHAMANMRFRVDPEIHISDNLRILSQIDMLDNVVLGSTPEGYVNTPNTVSGGSGDPAARTGSYRANGGTGYIPFLAFSQSQQPPSAGINAWQDSIQVKRVWAEYNTPIGQLRFGRMPNHWGLGILVNNGDRIDDDYQSHADRILFVTGVKSLDLYFGGAWDFPNSGRTSANAFNQQGQPYNVAQNENTNQWVLTAFRRVRPEIARQKLARGDVVINGGMYAVYRQQILASEQTAIDASLDTYRNNLGRIGARVFIPDLWFQILTKKLRWETELVYLHGSIENPRGINEGPPPVYRREDYKIRQFGGATELEYRALNDDLKLRFYSGFASGDQGVEGLAPPQGGLQNRIVANDKTVSTFRFNPSYRVDLILFRNILSRVQGVYYFRPGVEYDFTKSLDGEKFGGRAEVIYSRASKAIQTPGNKADLGIELDLTLYYQSRDGSLNNDPAKLGGFFAMLQYGVLFPLGGLGYRDGETGPNLSAPPDISTAQVVRAFAGAAF